MTDDITRRGFLRIGSALGFGAVLASASRAWGITRVENPLAAYPDRSWEHVYRDLYRTDSDFTFTCAPNDTHNCILRAFVKNGVLVRIQPTYQYKNATDLFGNASSGRWDPRTCQKGLALSRRFYGDRRVRYPMIRRGFKQWADGGFQRDENGRPPAELMRRGWDTFERCSWDEAIDYSAKVLKNIAETYSGEGGATKLRAQGYDEETITAMRGAGTQVLKFRGGMPLLGITRVFGMYRMAQSMALLDAKIRGVEPAAALGGRGWDNYSWHTDLPPGHTMVTGVQTVEFDLNAVEHSDLVLVWGMNWITTKMPDAHWLTEARLKGTRVVVIACEYSATANKGDDVLVCRPGVSPALALGLANVVVRENLYDVDYVKRFTDLPMLVRMDDHTLLRAGQVFRNYRAATLRNDTTTLREGEVPPPPVMQNGQYIRQALRDEWGDFVMWDGARSRPIAVNRDQVGAQFDSARVDPALEGEVEVTLADGTTVRCRPVFDLIKQYLVDNFSPEQTEDITWVPRAAVESLGRAIAAARGKTLFAVGMGPNQFFNNDLKDRTQFLLAALTGNVGRIGGNVGSYAGNYRVAFFNGVGQYISEDPFALQLDPTQPATVRQCWRPESAHYYNHGDKPLRYGNRLLTGATHMPTPTKSLWFANANSILGNVKWHYQVVNHQLPRMEFVGVNEWWWSTSCEYADIVFAVDSWAELKHPDVTASVTNSFLTPFPRTPLPRIHETLGDIEVQQRLCDHMGELVDEPRFRDMFKFVREGQTDVYLQRILNASSCTRGYQFTEIEQNARDGYPRLMITRTYPRAGGWEQIEESKPWWTKTGRMEFYRDEAEFRSAGENLPVFREPVDSTFYEPNVIVAAPHPVIAPEGPEAFGMSVDDVGPEARQARNVVKPWSEVRETRHPLMSQEGYRFIFHTPKYRHGAHTTPIDTDMISVWFGPFGDLFRRDRRSPWVNEGYVDIHPEDARELQVADGDYVWVDADPSDRPFEGWQENEEAYRVARLICRARLYPGTPRGVTRMWFNMYGATPGSVRGAAERADGLARNENTQYQAMFRSGSHQSATRGWLKPTLMTDSLVRKELFGHAMGKGFLPDSHCPTGAPRESFVKITRAEAGGMGGEGQWRPLREGFRQGAENEAFQRYLAGELVRTSE
ncbi:MAG: molybdopterin-dependent oxidoreductase [Sandaracinaceae bacterium]|nr:molybdopterin-dependent oxidoreductase [Sandaracinaceae bacterium]